MPRVYRGLTLPYPRARRLRLHPAQLAALSALALAGCGDDETTSTPPPTGSASTLVFDLDADLSQDGRFFDFPWPSDVRLTAEGTPDVSGYPNPSAVAVFDGLAEIARERPGFSTNPVAYLRFTGPLPELDLGQTIPADPSSPILLANVDPDSPSRGTLVPTVATVLDADGYAPENVLAIAPRPGFVLLPRTTYAFVVRRSLGDASGTPLGVTPALAELLSGRTPAGARGARAAASMAPLVEALDDIGIAAQDVAGATTFTTADVVADSFEMSSALVAAHPITIDGLTLDPDDGAVHERFCELHGTVTYPQFQRGTPPFDTEGTFEIGADGLPKKQRDEVAPIVITIPKAPMPRGGYPLMIYFHGSGGLSTQVVDRGPTIGPDGPNEKGKGPSHIVGAYGIATAASALPVNPERLPGASEIAYLNLDNLKAFRDTFRQGVIEQRMFIEALRTLEIPPAILAACAGPTLPAGETTFRFAEDGLVAMGQSMGGMYTNLIASTEPRIRAVVPTGAGGFWSYFILETSLLPGATTLVKLLLGLDAGARLEFVHPALSLLQLAWEPAEPMIHVPRLARRPLDGHPARPIYEPVGLGDSYFPTIVFDAMALAYGNVQAGEVVWPSMVEALALDGRSEIAAYPVSQNLESEGGEPYTGVVVQYEGDGVHDPHAIAFQLDEVKHQYGCFLATFLERGVATVPAPAPLGTACE